ncbi:MAG TPA: hypothetical protein VF092_25270 [Longimicrobium sp.]
MPQIPPRAWRELFGYTWTDADSAHVAMVQAARARKIAAPANTLILLG